MKNKILLVDGSCLLFRMFFGLPSRITDLSGNSIHAVVGFVGSLLKIVALFEPTHILVVFDTETSLFRKETESDYKGNRVIDWSEYPEDKNPFVQLPFILQALDALNWKYYEALNIEADDVIAAYARKYGEVDEVFIVSNDSDLMQLVGGSVKLYYPNGKKSVLYTEVEIREKYGIGPEIIPDYKSLVGDKTDNIRGVAGIGEKTAMNLLKKFGNIKNILTELDNISPESLKIRLQNNKELLLKNLSLISLTKEIEVYLEMDDFQIGSDSWKRKTMEVLKEIDII